MKITALSLIFLLCVTMGLSKRRRLYNRVRYLEDLISFVLYLKNSVEYRKETMDVIFREWKNRSSMNIFRSFESSDGESIIEKYSLSKKSESLYSNINGEDIECLDRLFNNMNSSDLSNNLTFIDGVKEDLERNKNEALSNLKKYGDLYLKLGISAGLFAIIICI